MSADSNSDEVLNLVIGEKTCTDGPWTKIILFIAFSVIATLVFFAMCHNGVDRMSSRLIQKDSYRLATKTALFFVIILILDLIFSAWKNSIVICGQEI